MLVSEKSREAAETCSSVIRMIINLQHQLYSTVFTTCECLISHSSWSMLLHCYLLDRKEGTNKLSTDSHTEHTHAYSLAHQRISASKYAVLGHIPQLLVLVASGVAAGSKVGTGWLAMLWLKSWHTEEGCKR